MKNIIVMTLCYLLSNGGYAQASTVEPGKPSLKDTIRLAYNCADPASVLDAKDTIYARITVGLQDGADEKFHITMQGAGEERSGRFMLPVKAASFKVEFYTLNKDDEKAAQNLLVYDESHSRPVEGAFLDAMFDERPGQIFDREMENHPRNYLAYAKFMNVVAMIEDQQAAGPKITRLLKKLDSVANREKETGNPGLLAAFCTGYAKNGSLPEGKKYLCRLFEQFPQAQETLFAFNIYNYEYYKLSRKYVEDDIRLRIKDIFTKYPSAPISGDGNVIQFLKDDRNIPAEAFERVLRPLCNEDKLQYYQLTSLPEIYIERNCGLGDAEALLDSVIKRYNTGSINHLYRLSYSQYQMYVPVIYLDLAKLCMLRKDYQGAITNASAASNILSGGNSEGNFLPLLLNVRARAYQKSGNLNLAMEDYKALYRMGDASALDSLRRLFLSCDVKQKSFEDFTSALNKKVNTADPAHMDMAPEIIATDLNGKTVHLSDFKGKLVVLNVWGTGCGPCVAEMPVLNQLVKQYGNQPDVVFLAITGDKKERLARFLKAHPFDYRILNNAGDISEKLNTNVLPVHMVIGKQGEILSRSIGARDDIKSYLQQIINNNL